MSGPGHHEIIIIKRGNEEEEGHHGGAWKIAFADFMTAMMALFLVLWLINAANEETKRAVASYFNPIKLVDRNRSAKGVEETKGGPAIGNDAGNTAAPIDNPSESKPVAPPANTESKVSPKAKGMEEDDAFFADPIAALDRIEASILEKNGISNHIETKGEDAMPGKFTDPFNSGYWQAEKSADIPEKNERNNSGVDAQETQSTSDKADQPSRNTSPEGQMTAETIKLEDEIHQEIAKSLGDEAVVKDAIKITESETGILIQVTDLPSTPMFDIGKAVPNGETIIATNAIAKALIKKPGKLQIYGHTDAREFGVGGNGNWRLSMNRAQSIYYILLRAGMSESRFSGITGFADRKLIVEDDPMADRNRRIEIFLEKP